MTIEEELKPFIELVQKYLLTNMNDLEFLKQAQAMGRFEEAVEYASLDFDLYSDHE